MTNKQDLCLTNLARVVAGVERLPGESPESLRKRCWSAMKKHDESLGPARFAPECCGREMLIDASSKGNPWRCRECGREAYESKTMTDVTKTVRYEIEFRVLSGTHSQWENYSNETDRNVARTQVRELTRDNVMEEGDRVYRLVEITELRETIRCHGD